VSDRQAAETVQARRRTRARSSPSRKNSAGGVRPPSSTAGSRAIHHSVATSAIVDLERE
jgi:hypothetical protein